MSLDTAISQLQEEIDVYAQGTSKQPTQGSTEWFLLRALTLGVQYLKRLKALGLDSTEDAKSAAAERVFRGGSAHFKAAEVPPAPAPVREVLNG